MVDVVVADGLASGVEDAAAGIGYSPAAGVVFLLTTRRSLPVSSGRLSG